MWPKSRFMVARQVFYVCIFRVFQFDWYISNVIVLASEADVPLDDPCYDVVWIELLPRRVHDCRLKQGGVCHEKMIAVLVVVLLPALTFAHSGGKDRNGWSTGKLVGQNLHLGLFTRKSLENLLLHQDKQPSEQSIELTFTLVGVVPHSQ